MAEYIEREAAHRMIVGLTHYSWASSTGAEHRSTVDADDVNFNLDKIPAADVAPVVHGTWNLIRRLADGADMECSVCGRSYRFNSFFRVDDCPYCHCGAKMDTK